mgnify:CR=1 FL=1
MVTAAHSCATSVLVGGAGLGFLILPPAALIKFGVIWIEGADLSEKSKTGTPRGSLALAFINKIHWWYGIVWAGLATWVVFRWGFEGY